MVGKDSQSQFPNILSVNPYSDSYFLNSSNIINNIKKPSFSKEQYVISNLDIKETINSSISVSKNIPEEDLFDAITTKAYDELGLDQAVEYKINYIETFTDIGGDERTFYVFIVDPDIIKETYKTAVEKIKYIDIIVPTPLLFKTLYTKKIIDDSSSHCFIYFQENDSFMTIYNDEEFVYTKSLKYSFSQMYERFCELYGERIEYEEFIEFFQKESLKDSKSDYKNYFIKLYKEIFASVNDILTYVKRAYEIEKIEHLYIGSQLQSVTKLDEMLEFELQINSSNLEFDYGFENSEDYIDQIQSLMLLYASLDENEVYDCNFTSFHRPPKFTKRQSGRIILLTAASIIAAFAYPATFWSLSYAKSIQYDILNQEYRQVHSQKTSREAAITSKEKEKKEAMALLSKEKQNYIDKKNTLIKIHDVKVNYPMKSKLISMFTKTINKHNVGLSYIKYTQKDINKHFFFNLSAKKDAQITSLIEQLTKIYGDKFDFSIENIVYDEADKMYSSELEIKIL